MTTLFFSFSGFSCCSTGVWLRLGRAMYKELFDAFLMLSDACIALSFAPGSKVWFHLLGFDCCFSDSVVFSTICSCYNNWELLHSINYNLQLTQFLSSLTLSGFWFIISSNCEFKFSILLFSALNSSLSCAFSSVSGVIKFLSISVISSVITHVQH